MFRKKRISSAITVALLLTATQFALGQNEFFDVAVLDGKGSIDGPVFALNPDTGTIVLAYTARLSGKPRMIAVNAAKVRKSGNPRFKKTAYLSDPALNSVVPSIVYHPGLKQFLVMWHSFPVDGDGNLTLGGRLLNKKGKLGNFSVGIGFGSELDLTFPKALARTNNTSSAPEGAEFFVVFVRRFNETEVFGQWYNQKLQPVGQSMMLIGFDNISLAVYDSLLIDGNTGLLAIEENYFDDFGKSRNTLSVFRFFLDGSNPDTQVVLKKDESDGWGSVDLFAASDKRIILGTIPDSSPAENYQIRNTGTLRASKKISVIFKDEAANSQNIVQLDDGRIYQVVLTEGGEIVVQQLNAKGKALGAPVAQITPPFDARFSEAQAIALPGRDDILIVLCDNSTPATVLKGSIIQIN